MMAAIASSNHEDVHGEERQRLLSELLEAVKQCQIRFGGRSELATESDHHVSVLCKCLEDVFSHGLRNRPLFKNSSTLEQVTGIVAHTFRYSQEPPCFWHYVRQYLTKHELDRYLSLKKVWTDIGRGRAWLRSSLNERSLDRYLHSLLANPTDASVYYHAWALLLDQELNSTLPNMAAGLSPILFAIGIDDGRLNQGSAAEDTIYLSKSEPVLTVPGEESHHGRRRKKVPVHIISFDGDRNGESSPDSTSAPPTCLSSSVQSASFLCSPSVIDQKTFESGDQSKKLDLNSASPSSNDLSFQDFDPVRKMSPNVHQDSTESRQTLTPISDSNVGELILISAEELPQEIVQVGDSDDGSAESLLNLKIDESLKMEDIRSLLATVEQVKETNSGLKTKLKALTTIHKEEKNKLQNQLKALTRENEMLKHQLRKYVEAVQMLNKDGAAHEALACLEASREAIQGREEAVQYQQKLVQVAEMHGELMEFNDRLHRLIGAKEDLIRRLERELTDLRGPLPSGALVDDDVMQVPDTLVNIWIPSAFLTGGSSDVHHVYQVYVKIEDVEWNVYRRYAQFHSLHKDLKKEYSIISTLDFPPKKTLGNKDSKFVEERRLRLQRYLRQVIDVVSRARSDLADPHSLVAIIPFFGQYSGKQESKAKGSQRNSFGRRGRQDPNYDSAQYNGL